MKVSILQAPTIGLDIKENRRWVSQHLNSSLKDKPDLILLPELWNTGYDPRLVHPLEEFEQEDIREELSQFAKQHEVYLIAGSIAYRKEGRLFNHTMVFDRQGKEIANYDKVHLFTGSNEANYFEAGSSVCNFSIDGIPVGLVNCYDLRFPEWIRLSSMGGEAQVLFVPAAWGYSRVYQMHLLARARAAENQLFTVVCNATKAPGHKALSGGQSIVFDPYGRDILSLGTEPGVYSIDLDLSLIKEVKDYLNLWNDRKPELYKGLDQR